MVYQQNTSANCLNGQINIEPITAKTVIKTGLLKPTAKQLRANQQNSKHSTGPNTAGGKTRSAGNALKHGLTASRLWLLPHESPSELRDFYRELFDAFAPVTAIEVQLVHLAIGYMWSLRRARWFEAALFKWSRIILEAEDVVFSHEQKIARPTDVPLYPLGRILDRIFENGSVEKLDRYQKSQLKQLRETLKLLKEMQEARIRSRILGPAT
jgi:hypothetical protein